MRPADTDQAAHQRQLEVWQQMSGSERLKMALDMSEFVRECARSRIRKRSPELSEKEVTRRLIFELYGV